MLIGSRLRSEAPNKAELHTLFYCFLMEANGKIVFYRERDLSFETSDLCRFYRINISEPTDD